ncbi:MAG TPA: DUF6318 family protein [Mycobacteriales bacterium]|jgi:hypothetical protein|nr:hypothetical protein [Cryptosporangiaceae bacterium]HEV7755912.1 DUF6318 family protein [Mycobacteriales bacterium]
MGLLVGCGAADPSATANENSDPATTPTAVVPSPAPALPAAIRAHGLAGAKATADYWFHALSYAQQSGDPKPLLAVSTSSCQGCSQLLASIRSAYAGGGSVSGGWYTVREMTSEEYSDAIPLLSVVFDRDALSIVGTGGATMQSVPALPFQTARLRLAYNGRWRVAQVTGMSALG